MAMDWWETRGTIEALGTAVLAPKLTTYSIIKVRGEDGRISTLENVGAGPRVNALLVPGQHIRIVGIERHGVRQAVAAATSDEAADDVDQLDRAFTSLRRFRMLCLAGIGGPILLYMMSPELGPALGAVPIALGGYLIMGRRANGLPSRDEMQRRIAALG